MPNPFRHHTVVVSYLALFLAAGGGAAYAQQRWMVSGVDVVDESLTSADLGFASVGWSEIAKDSVRASELDIDVKTVHNSTAGTGHSKTVTATCPPGYTVLGGGGGFSAEQGGERQITMTRSQPGGTTGWTVSAETIGFPAQKSDWVHRHDGDSFGDLVWKDWVWTYSADYKLNWELGASAVCAQL